ncbi:hypothetical protein HF673_00010 [Acidithiobacillus thiooxidans]|jgi:hypothetical protein|uniref:hypothetical protein n=1 Tax=Acidithiobacillus thiooxidans TaxID=930 RepID=UPI001C0771C0|nr:hypothetical protein [Acidithiobacillus thiooxidans]MBU2834201.1 hypothetical protein [Acidithiobacillus thiooxidans]
MSPSHVNESEQGAALLITVIVLSMIASLIAAASLELSQQNTETAAQLANYNQSRTAALVGIAGVKDFLNITQNSPNTANSGGTTCGTNGFCSFISSITSTFWGNSDNSVVPPNGGLGAIGYFNGQQLSINNISLKNIEPYINAQVSLHIIGNTYQIALPQTSNSSAQPAEPGLITVVSEGTSGQSSATAEAVLGPVAPLTPGASNTTISLNGNTTAGQIVNEAPAAQHTYLQTQGKLTTPTGQSPSGFTSVIENSTQTQVTISASTLESQANILFIPPRYGQNNPRIEFENIAGNNEINMGQEYRLTNNAISKGICVNRGWFTGYCYQRVPVFAPGTSLQYSNSNDTWSISPASSTSSSSSEPAILIPGAAYFEGNINLTSGGLYYNAIISNGNITDDATVYAPNYAGPEDVCGSPLNLYPTNFCGPQGTQFIPGSIGNIALYADGTITIGNNASVYGDILSRGDLTTTNNLNEYGFIVSEGTANTLNGTTTINNQSAPETFNSTPLNADDYSNVTPTTSNAINEPIGLLGLSWIN